MDAVVTEARSGPMPIYGAAATQSLSAQTRSLLAHGKLPVPVLLYLMTVVVPIGFNVGPLAMTGMRFLLLVMVLPMLAQLLMGRYGRILVTDVLFLLHILWATLALAINNPGQVVQQIGSVGMEFIGGYLMGRAYIRTPESFAALCRWGVVLVVASLPLALYETKTGHPIVLEFMRKLGITGMGISHMEPRMGLNRVQAIFAHPIHYGLFCSVALSLAFVALHDVSSTIWRFISAAIVGFCGFLALSSGALLAIALQIALIAWSIVFARLPWRWWLLVGNFVLAYIVIDLLSNRTPLSVFMSYATFSAHNAYWRSIIFEWGMKNIWAHPIFGIGLNDWVRPWYMRSGSMDNFWLVMGVRYGIPGFLLLAAGYAWAVFGLMRRNFNDDPVLSRFRRAWMFTFLGLSFTMTTVHIWTSIYSFVFFMFGAGMWMLQAGQVAEPSPAEKRAASQGAARGMRAGAEPVAAMSEAPAGPTGPVYSRFAPKMRTGRTLPGSDA